VIELVALISVAVFLAAFFRSGLVGVALEALAVMQQAVAAIRDPALDDAAREKTARAASLRLLGALGSILLRSFVVLAACAVPVVLADLAGLAPRDAVAAFLARWDVIVGLSVLITLGWIVGRRLWPST
jgi:hypothetical protein